MHEIKETSNSPINEKEKVGQEGGGGCNYKESGEEGGTSITLLTPLLSLNDISGAAHVDGK